jgi:hypothetical protein
VSLFEYVAIAFTLVFSYTAMRLIGGLPAALDHERRYWVHTTLVIGQLFSTAAIFWTFWSFRDVDWTLGSFLLVLTSPGLIYYNACALVPENPETVVSWRTYYYSARRRYFTGVGLWALSVAITSSVILELPVVHPVRTIQGSALALGLVGASTANPRVHAGIAVFMALFVLSAAALVARPGALAP